MRKQKQGPRQARRQEDNETRELEKNCWDPEAINNWQFQNSKTRTSILFRIEIGQTIHDNA